MFSKPNGKAVFHKDGWVDGWMKVKPMDVKLDKVLPARTVPILREIIHVNFNS